MYSGILKSFFCRTYEETEADCSDLEAWLLFPGTQETKEYLSDFITKNKTNGLALWTHELVTSNEIFFNAAFIM